MLKDNLHDPNDGTEEEIFQPVLKKNDFLYTLNIFSYPKLTLFVFILFLFISILQQQDIVPPFKW